MTPFNDNANGEVDNGPNGSPTKRQRAKQACEPCRLRKRKCDGTLPCNMCTQFEYKCYFEKHSRKRSKLVEQRAASNELNPAEAQGASEDLSSGEDMSNLRNMEANSGVAFTRLLGQRLDPSSGPKLFSFGWNLGHVPKMGPSIFPQLAKLTDILTYDQFSTLSKLYFENVHPIYGVLDKDWTLEQARLRWTDPDSCKVPDHLLAGIGALASLFCDSSMSALVPPLAELQKWTLDNGSLVRPPTLYDIQSWIIRSLFYRGTDHPHSTHMATVISVHLAEAIGLHQELGSATLHNADMTPKEDPEVKRRVFWVTRMLNAFISFEYGRTRVMLRNITTKLPTPRDGDYTTDFIELYSISCCLDPETSDKTGQWEDFLRRLEAYDPRHDGIGLSKYNLAMCGYRRLRLASPVLSPQVANRVINLGLAGLRLARKMAEKNCAWWHVANVPFQTVCVFLAMDTRESLAHVGTAVRTLEFVTECFGTVTMKDALKTARFLVHLSKKRKDEDSNVLNSSLGRQQPEGIDNNGGNGKQDSTNFQPIGLNRMTSSSISTGTPHTTLSSSEEWGLDYLGDSHFDWNTFLASEMVAMSELAPDGTM